jgi:hypothetical protein
VSIDPVVPSAGDPQSHNGYSYARNNPLTLTDPNGTCPTVFACGFSATGGGMMGTTTTYTISTYNEVKGERYLTSTETLEFGSVGNATWIISSSAYSSASPGHAGMEQGQESASQSQYPQLAGGDPIAVAQALRQAHEIAEDDLVKLEGIDQIGIKGTIAPTGVGPAVSVELRSSTTRGTELAVIGGVGTGGSVQVNPIARTGLALTAGEMGPVHGVLQATFPTGVIPGTVATVGLGFSLFPLGTQFSVRVGLGGGMSGIAGIQATIPLSSSRR